MASQHLPQQLNLLDARHVPQPVPWSARQALVGAAGGLALCALAGSVLHTLAERQTEASQEMELAVAPLRQQMTRAGLVIGPVAAQDEVQRLRQAEQAQRRVRQALETGVAGNRQGHAEYLMALARQAPGTVWITGFAVSEDGGAIELAGRMADTAVFADYLRRLNAEPRFKGRPFAQLQLEAVNAAPGAAALPGGITAFTLRSTAIGPSPLLASGGTP